MLCHVPLLPFFQELHREGFVNILIGKIADFVKENGRAHSEYTKHVVPLKDGRQRDICNENGHFAFDTSKQISQDLRYVESSKQD
jgi:hypothetical protein